jgi:hypothetical protein
MSFPVTAEEAACLYRLFLIYSTPHPVLLQHRSFSHGTVRTIQHVQYSVIITELRHSPVVVLPRGLLKMFHSLQNNKGLSCYLGELQRVAFEFKDWFCFCLDAPVKC